MGTPIEEIEYRDDCLRCPAIFPPGRTPKIMHIVFENVQKCPGTTKEPPNNQVFHLEPDPADNCSWHNPSHPSIYIYLTFWYYWTFVMGKFLEPVDEFFNTFETNPACILSGIANGLTCEYWHYFGGLARVFWEPDALPHQLAVDYALCQMPGGVSDRVPAADGGQCIKLANPIDKTNILVKVYP